MNHCVLHTGPVSHRLCLDHNIEVAKVANMEVAKVDVEVVQVGEGGGLTRWSACSLTMEIAIYLRAPTALMSCFNILAVMRLFPSLETT